MIAAITIFSYSEEPSSTSIEQQEVKVEIVEEGNVENAILVS